MVSWLTEPQKSQWRRGPAHGGPTVAFGWQKRVRETTEEAGTNLFYHPIYLFCPKFHLCFILSSNIYVGWPVDNTVKAVCWVWGERGDGFTININEAAYLSHGTEQIYVEREKERKKNNRRKEKLRSAKSEEKAF